MILPQEWSALRREMCSMSNAAEMSRKRKMEEVIHDFGKNIVGIAEEAEAWVERVVKKMQGEELETVQLVLWRGVVKWGAN